MGVGGSNVLAAHGYSPAHILALEEVSRRIGRDVNVGYRDGRAVLSWDYPIPTSSQTFHEQADIKARWRGDWGVFVLLEPGFTKTSLTERETRYVLPVERPHDEVIAFNPFQKKDVKTGAAVGTYSYPGMPGRKGELLVRPLQPEEIPRIVKSLERGKTVELWRWGVEIPKPAEAVQAPLKVFARPQPSIRKQALKSSKRSPESLFNWIFGGLF